ncbi:MAG TPA: flagellar FlbD family protein [Bryobacteraceae bacterium]|jgi:flagellar protein FlbD|nr:flagellar FlbD family protein [Bryobacteraceae bacterium]
MIHLTRINRVPLVLNSDLIEHVEATPDTVISLTTGQKILVLESPSEIVDRVIQFRRSVGGVFAPARGAHADLRRVPAHEADSVLEPRD